MFMREILQGEIRKGLPTMASRNGNDLATIKAPLADLGTKFNASPAAAKSNLSDPISKLVEEGEMHQIQ